ncbi:MAG: tol-pal system protein YbgF [Candidatus Latescibacteria bacterium]|nr:tol-pal system protein YbgF [Candidatus Latescibacterota bacterium]
MNTKRLEPLVAIIGFSIILLSAMSFSGCSPFWQWVRKGTQIDNMEDSISRLDSLNKRQNQLLNEMNADFLTELEQIRQEIAQISAKLDDSQDGMSRLYQRFGVTRTEPQKIDTPSTRVPTSVDPDELYNTAYLDYTRGNYDIAIQGFKRYLQLFPDTELSDNAQYWIGESYYSQRLYSDAILEFEKVVTNYPDGNKVVSALYKIGLAYQFNNETTKAKQYYKHVFEQFPTAPEANLARERFNSLP